MCNAQFKSAFSNTDGSDTPTPSGEKLPTMPTINISQNGVLKLLKNLKPHKATGPDELPARVLKECASELAPMLTSFFQQSLDEGRVPDDWNQQRVHPKKCCRSDLGNYRPLPSPASCARVWNTSWPPTCTATSNVTTGSSTTSTASVESAHASHNF